MKHLERLRNAMREMDRDEEAVRNMYDGTKYMCAVCGKEYLRHGWFRKRQFAPDSNIDKPLSTFMRMSLLLLDTTDAYHMGDGDRICGNAKFEWLYAGPANHIKYRLWLWRMLAYNMAVLSPREAYEYIWNTTININGGHGRNIPNDNMAENQRKEASLHMMKTSQRRTTHAHMKMTMHKCYHHYEYESIETSRTIQFAYKLRELHLFIRCVIEITIG